MNDIKLREMIIIVNGVEVENMEIKSSHAWDVSRLEITFDIKGGLERMTENKPMPIMCRNCHFALDYKEKFFDKDENGKTAYKCPRCGIIGVDIFFKNDLELPSLPFDPSKIKYKKFGSELDD